MAEKVRLSGLPDEHTHDHVNLTGTPEKFHLSGLPDSEWLALQSRGQ
jgi:hypothetical protein